MENSIIMRVKSFKDWFREYEDHYVIIGGTACYFLMDEFGAAFRPTNDVDIVLLLEALDADFGSRLSSAA